MNGAMTMRGVPRKLLLSRNLTLVVLGLLLIGALWVLGALAGPMLASLLPTAGPAHPGTHAPLLLLLLQQGSILRSVALSTLIMVCALLVWLAPLTWWIYLLTAFSRQSDPVLAQTMSWVQAQQALAQPSPALDPGLDPMAAQSVAFPSNPAFDGTAATSGVPPVPAGSPPGGAGAAVPAPGAPAGAGQPPASGAPPAAAGQPVAPGATPPVGQAPQGTPPPAAAPVAPANQPAVAAPPVPAQPVSTLQQALAAEETLNLAELTSVDDILSNAFNDDEEVDERLLRISQSLAEVDLAALVDQTHQINEQLRVLGVLQVEYEQQHS